MEFIIENRKNSLRDCSPFKRESGVCLKGILANRAKTEFVLSPFKQTPLECGIHEVRLSHVSGKNENAIAVVGFLGIFLEKFLLPTKHFLSFLVTKEIYGKILSILTSGRYFSELDSLNFDEKNCLKLILSGFIPIKSKIDVEENVVLRRRYGFIVTEKEVSKVLENHFDKTLIAI